METSVAEMKAAADRGIEAMNRRRPQEAGLHFNEALTAAEAIADERTRREEISVLATLFDQCGFTDLALMAAEEAVDLDRSLDLENELAVDLLAVGNAHVKLENEARAEAAYQEALAISLKRKLWTDAAGATTNLAGMLANRGQTTKAAEMLHTSLGYLDGHPFPETERNTRLALLQVLEIEKGDVDEAFANAKVLCGTFWNELPPDLRPAMVGFVERMIERYREAHPEARKAAWKNKHFPMLGAETR